MFNYCNVAAVIFSGTRHNSLAVQDIDRFFGGVGMGKKNEGAKET